MSGVAKNFERMSSDADGELTLKVEAGKTSLGACDLFTVPKFPPSLSPLAGFPKRMPGTGEVEPTQETSTTLKEAGIADESARDPKSPQEVIQMYKPEASDDSSLGTLRLPDKMMAILVREEAADAIWWLQKGTAFAMQKEKFQEKILDKHFRGNKFKSLVRNLHRW